MLTADVLSDEVIVERILDGDVQLFELLMRRHNQKLYRIARGMGVGDEECDDVIQQAYVHAYTKLDRFRRESSFSTWLVRIVINECLMLRRKSQLAVTPEGEFATIEETSKPQHESATPESEMIKHEVRRLLEESIARLPDDYRIVYLMREIEGMPIKQIAGSLGISEGATKVRLLRARAKLRHTLKRYLDPSELYGFGHTRCDRIVASVMRQLG